MGETRDIRSGECGLQVQFGNDTSERRVTGDSGVLRLDGVARLVKIDKK